LFLLFVVLCFSVFAQQKVEQEGVRTSDSTPYPVLWEERSPSDIKNAGGWYTLYWASQPAEKLGDTIQGIYYYFINYLSYYALSDAAIQRQIQRFEQEFLTGGDYILTITDSNTHVVSQISIKIEFLTMNRHQPIVKFIFPHQRY
jgi:hypothetical protein